MRYSNLGFFFVCVVLLRKLKYAQSSKLGDILSGILHVNLTAHSGNATVLRTNKSPVIEKPSETTPSPFLRKLQDISKFSGDIMHGDYVGASLDGVDFLETFSDLKWPIKLFLKILENILEIIHPIYLAIFPKARNNGSFADNLMFSMTRSGGMLTGNFKVPSKKN